MLKPFQPDNAHAFRPARSLHLRLAAFALFAAALPLHQANATQSVECNIDDKNVMVVVQAAVGSAGGGMANFGGEAELKLKGIPEDLRKLAFEREHLTQVWFDSPDLRLRVYRERADDKPHGYVEIAIVTRRKGRDEDAPYAGAYELTVHHITKDEGGEGKTVKARGKVACSAGG
jgi:hypothetical protein